MKKRKKQIFAILMIFCMAVCYMPSFSFAAAEGNAENTASNAIATEEDLSKGGTEEGGSGAETDTETIDPKAQESSEDNIDAAEAELTEAIENDVKVSKEIEEEVLSAEEGEDILLYTPILRAATIVDGTTINYTVTRIGEDNKKPLFHSGDYIGSCIQVGTSANDDGGTATVHALSKDNIIVKTVYYMHVVLKWWPSGTNSQINQAERAIQYASMPEAADRRMRELDYDEATIAKIHGYVQTASSITVPDSFEAFSADAGSDQDFIIYKYNEGALQLQKQQLIEGVNFVSEAPNNYSLSGAAYEIYTDPNCTQRAYTPSGGQLVPVTLTTTESGLTNIVSVPAGTYYAKEVTASKGFLIDPSADGVTVTTGNTSANPAVINSTEDPTVGRLFRLKKIDKTGEEGWRKLLGAQYTLSYYDVDPSTTDVSGLAATRSWTFETVQKQDADGDYYAGIDFMTDTDNFISGDDFYMEKVDSYTLKEGEETEIDPDIDEDYYKILHHYRVSSRGTSTRVMPVGVYTIEETAAPRGLKRNTTVYYGNVSQPSNGAVAVTNVKNSEDFEINVTTGELNNAEEPPKIKLVLNKEKQQTGESEAEESESSHSSTRKAEYSSLAGARYEVYYDDAKSSAPVLVGYITTDENGYGELTKRTHGQAGMIGEDLRVGDYLIKEITTAPGFLLDKYSLQENGSTTELNNVDIEVICDYEADGTPVKKTISGSYKDGMHLFKVNAFGSEQGVAEYTVTITSEEPGTETYIKKTDATTTEELPGATLQVYSLNEGSYGTLVEEWTSTSEEHLIKELPSGKYLLREITAPYGYDVAEDMEFEVSDSEVVNRVEMANKPLTIGTTATDPSNHTHHGVKADEETITDVVTVSGLYEGRTYKVIGTLMDKDTGEAVEDAQGNKITAESDPFVATKDSMEVTVSFTVDSSDFDTDKVVVAFERLYRTEQVPTDEEYPARDPEDELPIDIGRHEDLTDEAQSIHYGGIVRTVATDKKSLSHNILAAKGGKIVDNVQYENLSSENTYRLCGEIYDKTAGQLTGVTARLEFKPEAADGMIDLTFDIDTSGLENHDLVVYEKLYVLDTSYESITPVEVDTHEDPDDESQTVHVPQIRTNAEDLETEDHIAYGDSSITIKDVVTYKNLIPNKSYTIKGKLMSKNTGKAIVANGSEVTATKTFTPLAKDGTVELTFTFDGSALLGDTVVAYEQILINDEAIAVHEDLNDEDQSVHIPKIRTSVGKKTSDGKVIDVVTYSNLVPGRTYTLKGWFVKVKTGERVSGTDGWITFAPASANGTIEVQLTDVKGTGNLVAFEECYLVKDPSTNTLVLVGDHKDKNDKAQLYKKTGKIVVSDKDKFKSSGVKTGDNTLIALWIALLATASAGIVVVGVKRRRDKIKEENDILA